MNPVETELIYPLFAMFLLANVVLFKMFIERKKSVQAGETAMAYYKTYSQGSESPLALQAARHYINLYEAPVFFYVVCILGMILPVQTFIFTVLAWAYVGLRGVHAFIHMGQNKIRARMAAFAASWLVLILMWITVLIKALNIATTDLSN